MSEAPKKTWWDVWDRIADENQDDESEIPYIRANIVDELIQILEWNCATLEAAGIMAPTGRAALARMKKLEESHD